MKQKPISPYVRLCNAARKWALGVIYPRRLTMFFFPKKDLHQGWSLSGIYERTAAANLLGYDVRCVAQDDGLRFEYVKRPDEIPKEIHP